MAEILESLMYTESHEWLRQDDKKVVTIGVTAHAQQRLGDVVFVELPEVGDEVNVSGECGVVESVKAATDFYSPVSGKVDLLDISLYIPTPYVAKMWTRWISTGIIPNPPYISRNVDVGPGQVGPDYVLIVPYNDIEPMPAQGPQNSNAMPT